MSAKINYIDRPFEVKSVGSDGTFQGYGSIFGELDSYRDIVLPGAFKQSLQDDFAAKGRKVPMLWQHDSWAPIGIYTTIKEDDIGLYVEGQCNLEVQKGRECHALMKQGALSGLSIGYSTMQSEWDEKTLTRKLKEVTLWEVSPVTFPAGDNARVQSVKAIEDLTTYSALEAHMRDAYGMSRKEAMAWIAKAKAIAPVSDSGEADAISNVKSIIRSITR